MLPNQPSGVPPVTGRLSKTPPPVNEPAISTPATPPLTTFFPAGQFAVFDESCRPEITVVPSASTTSRPLRPGAPAAPSIPFVPLLPAAPAGPRSPTASGSTATSFAVHAVRSLIDAPSFATPDLPFAQRTSASA